MYLKKLNFQMMHLNQNFQPFLTLQTNQKKPKNPN
jgi:hypothetical protein